MRFLFYFLECFKNRTVLKETLNNYLVRPNIEETSLWEKMSIPLALKLNIYRVSFFSHLHMSSAYCVCCIQ